VCLFEAISVLSLDEILELSLAAAALAAAKLDENGDLNKFELSD
jgi:hypothetical protein